jgi:SPP1 gp7 family putative phage head morphogenesis protein
MPKQPDFSNKTLFQETLKLKRKSMTAGNRKRSQKFKARSTWIYPFALERRYAKALKKIMGEFTSSIVSDIRLRLQGWINEFRGDSFPSELADNVDEWRALLQRLIAENPDVRLLITNAGFDISEQNNKQWQKFNKQLLGIEFVVTEPWETAVIEAWGQNNFELIKSLSDEFIKKVNLLVSEGVQTGRTWDVIMRDIGKMTKNMSKSRAELIARDQIGKLHGMTSQRRQEDAGIDKYIWLTVGDERVRSKHKTLNGKVCRWDNPNVYSDDNGKTWKRRTTNMTKVHPGIDIQCRCSALPFFDDIIEETDKIIKEEESVE